MIDNKDKLFLINGEYYSQKELEGFIESNTELAQKVERQTRFIKALKIRCNDYAIRNQELESEIKDMKFTRKYLTSEDAGKAFARELLGKPMTQADLDEERAIADGESYYAKTWNLACGDDF